MRFLAALLLSAVSACVSNGSEAAERREDTAGRRDSVAGVAAAALTEAGVIGLLQHVHASDSALGALGAQRGSSTEVKEFARMILREHMALRREAAGVASDAGLQPQAPTVAPADAPEVMRADLLSAPAGGSWDRLYIQYAIAMHEAAMENTARALAATKRPEVRQLIDRSVPILDKHVAKARSLEKRMSGVTAAGKTP
jgi:putative membrane protein